MRGEAIALATVLGADARQALTPELVFFGVIIGKPRHGRVVVDHAAVHIVADKATTHTRAAAGTTARPFTVASQCVAPSKLAIALWTYMGLLARMKLAVSLQVVETTEAHLTICTYERLLLAMCQEVTLEVVVAGEFGTAIWALVFLGT
jgi:hypothetical protein